MKKLMIITFMVFGMLNIQAQDYLIGFAGTGDTNVVTTVKIDNLTSGATLTLNGGDILHLTSQSGIGDLEKGKEALQIYPNPMTGQSVLTFYSPRYGNTFISIIDLSGKTVCQINTMIPAGLHSFRISGINRGMHFVRVAGEDYSYAAKLISLHSLQSLAAIEYMSTTRNQIKSVSTTIDMLYTTGDQLLFKGMSGIYSTIVADVPSGNDTITFNFAACIDADNNNYSIVEIGDQTWMAENLNTGVRIDSNKDQTNNSILEKYCYNNDETNCDLYGGLYAWDEIMQYINTPAVQGICPAGWHIPTDSDWCTLTQFLDETVNCSAIGWSGTDAGGKIKSTGTVEAGTGLFYAPNTGATNESGFSGLAAGNCDADGLFSYLGLYGYWWTSTELSTNIAWSWSPDYSSSSIVRGNNQKVEAYSLRCLRN